MPGASTRAQHTLGLATLPKVILTALVSDWLGRPVELDIWTVQDTGFAPHCPSRSVRPQAHGHVLAAAKWRCPQRLHACTNCGVGEPSRVRALTREVAAVRAEIEEYRAELRDVLDRFLDEHPRQQHARWVNDRGSVSPVTVVGNTIGGDDLVCG